LTIILLARVITRLGDIKHVDTKTIEKLFTADLAYLQSLYRQINDIGLPKLNTACPKCEHEYEVEVDFLSVTEGLS
jgi:phage FluMu protein gp41